MIYMISGDNDGTETAVGKRDTVQEGMKEAGDIWVQGLIHTHHRLENWGSLTNTIYLCYICLSDLCVSTALC